MLAAVPAFYFRTMHMDSYVHATQVPITGMVALEMLGYYDGRRGSQHYHQGTDTLNRLSLPRLALAVEALLAVLTPQGG